MGPGTLDVQGLSAWIDLIRAAGQHPAGRLGAIHPVLGRLPPRLASRLDQWSINSGPRQHYSLWLPGLFSDNRTSGPLTEQKGITGYTDAQILEASSRYAALRLGDFQQPVKLPPFTLRLGFLIP